MGTIQLLATIEIYDCRLYLLWNWFVRYYLLYILADTEASKISTSFLVEWMISVSCTIECNIFYHVLSFALRRHSFFFWRNVLLVSNIKRKERQKEVFVFSFNVLPFNYYNKGKLVNLLMCRIKFMKNNERNFSFSVFVIRQYV